MSEVVVSLPRPHEAQKRVLAEARRFNVGAMGRRWGKSKLAINLAADPILDHGWLVGYFAPTYKLLAEYWREFKARLEPAMRKIQGTERRMESHTGGVLECWTLEDEDAGRSRKYNRVIIDEAGLVAHLGETWEAAIRPTLADLEGDAWFLGTPKGRNFFWQAHQYGLDPHMSDWVAWQMPTSSNPYIPPGEIEAMRQTMSERRFRQEVMAEFLDDGGGVFRRVREAATAKPLDAGVENGAYVIGVDWGRENDFTVMCVLDSRTLSMVTLDRSTKIEYEHQRGRLKALYERFPRASIIAESNAMGQPVIEQLWRERIPVQPFHTSNASKLEIIDALALAFERGQLKILNDPTLIGELEAYESERLPSGLIRYGAPEGFHDDCVMALAFALYGARSGWSIL